MDEKQAERKARELRAIQEAKLKQECVVYMDDDGCEVTATPSGHAFYNVADWW